MAYVSVDVDMDDFDTDDLAEELSRRIIKSKGNAKKIQHLKNDLISLISAFSLNNTFEVKTLDDKMKVEHFSSIANKYTLAHIQNVLP